MGWLGDLADAKSIDVDMTPMRPLVIVPARLHSQGVPGKNFKPLPDGTTLIGRAIAIGQQIGHVVVTTDHYGYEPPDGVRLLLRPSHLAQDDTPMAATVEDVLRQVPGEPDGLIVLLQPTTPLRTLGMVKNCIETARDSASGTAATVLPHHVRYVPCRNGQVYLPDRRQAAQPLYSFSGTAYAWLNFGPYFPDNWTPCIDDDVPQLNVDTAEDWARLSDLLK